MPPPPKKKQQNLHILGFGDQIYRCFLYIIIDYKNNSNNLMFTMFIIYCYIFCNNCHVVNKSHVVNVLSPLRYGVGVTLNNKDGMITFLLPWTMLSYIKCEAPCKELNAIYTFKLYLYLCFTRYINNVK